MVGDIFILAKKTTGEVAGLVFENTSQWLNQAHSLFGLSDISQQNLQIVTQGELSNRLLPATSDPILESIGYFPEQQTPEQPGDATTPAKSPRGAEVERFTLRPAARLIGTIGTELIKDAPAAVIELVKNSYDADSPRVGIEMTGDFTDPANAKVKFTVWDRGHGMSYDTVVKKWMVPATPYKSERRFSPKGRRMQGNKGIGRYASFLLGKPCTAE